MDKYSDDADIKLEKKPDHYRLTCTGSWNLQHINVLVRLIEQLTHQIPKRATVVWDIAAIKAFDSAGIVLLLQSLRTLREQHQCQVDIVGADQQQQRLLGIFQNKSLSRKINKNNNF